jgi:ABC-2 type transport system permease protein
MRSFLGFIKKEFYHIFRDFRTLVILFGIPVAQILIFGYVISNDIKDIRVAIYDQSHDDITRAITNKILSSGYFILEKEIFDANKIEEVFRQGKVKEVIVFGPNFAETLSKTGKVDIRIIADASDANTGNLISGYTNGIIMNYMTELNKSIPIPYTINQKTRMYYNPELKSVYMFVPGTMALILILISALMTSISITREKEMGTMETLLVSPLRPYQIILGKVTPYIILSFISAITILLLGYFIFGVPVNGSLFLLLLLCIVYVSLSLSLGIFISTMANSQQTAMFLSMIILMLPTIILSGFIFPIANMPEVLQYFSALMPARWFIVALKHIMIKGTGLLFIWKELLILTGMTVLFLSLSIRRFSNRLE